MCWLQPIGLLRMTRCIFMPESRPDVQMHFSGSNRPSESRIWLLEICRAPQNRIEPSLRYVESRVPTWCLDGTSTGVPARPISGSISICRDDDQNESGKHAH